MRNSEMKVLYFGGQKSGKSTLGEKHTLMLAGTTTPIYIATYDNSYNDIEMKDRIDIHQRRRKDLFRTIEEPLNLSSVIKPNNTYLIDCMSMWLLNHLCKSNNSQIPYEQIEEIANTKANIVFILNDVNSGIIPPESLSRKFVDSTGILGAKLASICNEVYTVTLGIKQQIK
jgi:adenosylcobinamide kinase/adenosylcobinamide-phosphate guanylyltransferase